MAACGSLQHIFDKPLPDTPTLLESLSSWNQLKPVKPPIEQSSFTELFGELHFKESCSQTSSSSSSSPSPSSSFPILSSSSLSDFSSPTESSKLPDFLSVNLKNQYPLGGGGSNIGDSLQLCTEGLGFESSADVDLKNDITEYWQNPEEETRGITRHSTLENQSGEFRRSKSSGGAFPPPISCIGKTGKPWVCFKSYRHDGRFVLKEVRIPTQEFLHACREDGRLKLQFIQPDDEILDELEEEEGEEESLTGPDSGEENDDEKGSNDCKKIDNDG